MINRISKTEELIAKLTKEGKCRVLIIDPLKQQAFDADMQSLRRDYIYKSLMSEIAASKTIINC